MRVAIFVAIMAAHVVMLLLFPSLWPVAPQGRGPEPAVLPVFLPPLQKSVPQTQTQTQQEGRPGPAPASRSPPWHRSGQESNTEPQGAPEQPAPGTSPDWRTQAQESAQIIAQRLVADEDAAKRTANALTSSFKPLTPPTAREPQFGWDWAATHRLVPMAQGGFVYHFNDPCQLAIFPMPFLGCRLGKIQPKAVLFENMPRRRGAIQHGVPGK